MKTTVPTDVSLRTTRSRLPLLAWALFLAFALALASAFPAAAADIDLITDEPYVLSDEEYLDLNEQADALAAKHNCEVAVVVIATMDDEDDATGFAEFVYDHYNLGSGADKSGLLLFLSLAEQEYALLARGYGDTAFTAYGQDLLMDQLLPLLADGAYYEAFQTYLDTADEYLQKAKDGSPVDNNSTTAVAVGGETKTDDDSSQFGFRLAATILLPLLVAGLLCMNWKGQMQTARFATTADLYIPADGFRLTGQEDQFLFRTEERRKIERTEKKTSGGSAQDKGNESSTRSGKF